MSEKPYTLSSRAQDIGKIFSLATLEEIFQALEKNGSEWALKDLATLKKMVSPIVILIVKRKIKRLQGV